MKKEQIEKMIFDLYETFPGNRVEEEIALSPEAAGVRFFEKPLVGIGAANDPLFEKLRSDEVTVSWYMGPEEWLDGAKAIISMFFPCLLARVILIISLMVEVILYASSSSSILPD